MLELINPKERRGNEGIKSRRGVMEEGKGEGKVAKSRPSTLADMQLTPSVVMWPRTKTILMFFAPTAVFHKRDYSVENERGNVKAGTIS